MLQYWTTQLEHLEPLLSQELVYLLSRWLSSSALKNIIFVVKVATNDDICQDTVATEKSVAFTRRYGLNPLNKAPPLSNASWSYSPSSIESTAIPKIRMTGGEGKHPQWTPKKYCSDKQFLYSLPSGRTMRQPFSYFKDGKTIDDIRSRGQSGVLASGGVFKVIAVFGRGDNSPEGVSPAAVLGRFQRN